MSDNKLKRIWDVEIDLLEKCKAICKKYNLNYCASSGTLLGAVRHAGFIPWDDDIDLFCLGKTTRNLWRLLLTNVSIHISSKAF